MIFPNMNLTASLFADGEELMEVTAKEPMNKKWDWELSFLWRAYPTGFVVFGQLRCPGSKDCGNSMLNMESIDEAVRCCSQNCRPNPSC